MAEHKAVIKHALFRLTGGRMVTRGQEVTLSKADYDRAVKADAIVDSLAELEIHGELPEFPEDGDLSEQASWMRSATVEDIQAAVDENPGLAEQLAAAELLRGSEARSDVLNLLEDVEPADPEETDLGADVDLTTLSPQDLYAWVTAVDGDEKVERASKALEVEEAKGDNAYGDLVRELKAIVDPAPPAPAGQGNDNPPAPDPLDISESIEKIVAWVDRAGDEPGARLARAQQALAAENGESKPRVTLVGDLEATIAAEQAAAQSGS